MKRLLIVVSAVIVGCANPNEYKEWFEGNTSVERQMEILNILEKNGWTDVGFSCYEGSILVTARRKRDGGAK